MRQKMIGGEKGRSAAKDDRRGRGAGEGARRGKEGKEERRVKGAARRGEGWPSLGERAKRGEGDTDAGRTFLHAEEERRVTEFGRDSGGEGRWKTPRRAAPFFTRHAARSGRTGQWKDADTRSGIQATARRRQRGDLSSRADTRSVIQYRMQPGRVQAFL